MNRLKQLKAAVLVLVLCFVLPVWADDSKAPAKPDKQQDKRPDKAQEPKPDKPAKPKVGIFTTTFTERSPQSDPKRMSKVTRWSARSMPKYKVADHTFQMVVPKDYDGSEPYGLLVFIHPNNKISLERFYGKTLQKVLAKQKLIWVSYSDAGNPVMPNIRIGLALDAVHNVSKAYRINTGRVYLSGLSGGGRMTCLGGIYYPQIFRGLVPIVGTLYFRDVKLSDDPKLRALIPEKRMPPNGVFPRGLIPPRPSMLRAMKERQRWALLAGEKDYNMPEMRAHFEQGFKQDGFKHAHYLEVPKMPHTYPDAAWYEKAIVLLDKPLKQKQKRKK